MNSQGDQEIGRVRWISQGGQEIRSLPINAQEVRRSGVIGSGSQGGREIGRLKTVGNFRPHGPWANESSAAAAASALGAV
jgi:hypothetical protein